MHGHLHRAYQRTCEFGYGPVQVTGLDADGQLRNFAVLDVAAMTWELRGSSWLSRRRRGIACQRPTLTRPGSCTGVRVSLSGLPGITRPRRRPCAPLGAAA